MIDAKRRPSRPLPARPLKNASSREAILQELFAHYDLHRDGHICPEAFASTQRIVRRLTSGLAVSGPVSASNATRASSRPSSGNRSGHESSHLRRAGPSLGVVGTEIVGSVRGRAARKARMPSPPAALARLNLDLNLAAPPRSPSFTSYGNAESEVAVTDLESFLLWQNQLLEASSKSSLEKRQRLMWLVSELSKLDLAQTRSEFWQKRNAEIKKMNEEVNTACQIAGRGDTLAGVNRIVSALHHIQDLLQEEAAKVQEGNLAATAAEKGRQLLTELKTQWESEFAAEVDGGASCAAVTDKLKAAASILGEEELAPYFERLEHKRQPFDLKVVTLSGSEKIVKVSRVSTVLELKGMLALDFDVLPYRLKLSGNDGEVLSDTRTLEDFGITEDGANVFVVIGEANKYREMSHEDFVELVVTKRVDVLAGKRSPEGLDEWDEWKFRQKYVPRLIAIEEKEERQRQRKEQIRQKQESIAAEAKDVLERLGEGSEAEQHFASIVLAVEADCHKHAQKCQAIKDDAQQDLDEAMPALENAYRAMDRLDKKDMHEMTSFSKPPPLVLTVVEAVHILLEGRKCNSWSEGMKLMRNPRLLDEVRNYDKDSISPEIIAHLQPYMARDDFTPDAINRMCLAAGSFCIWVRAMHVYYTVAQRVWPIKDALDAAQEDLDDVMQELHAWMSRLKDLRAKMASMEAAA